VQRTKFLVCPYILASITAKGCIKFIFAATIGVEVHPLDFTTRCGKICFYSWDISVLGKKEFGGLMDVH
jgi:hypothetical protein